MDGIHSDRNIILKFFLVFTWIILSETLPTLPVPRFMTLQPPTYPTFRLTAPPVMLKKACRQKMTQEEAVSRYLPSCASCLGKCGNISKVDPFSPQGCSCDSSCVTYRDCCHDFATHCPQEAKESPDLIMDQPASCRTIQGVTHHDEDYLLIGSCQRNETACRISKDSLNSFVPVFDVERKLHFVNLNCAVCNGAKRVVPWKNILTCLKEVPQHRQNLSETITKDEFDELWKVCKVDLIPDEATMEKPRTCVAPQWIRSRPCDISCEGTEFEKLCYGSNGHKTYLEARGFSFSNFFCLLCVEPVPNDVLKKVTDCFIDVPVNRIAPPSFKYFSFRLLFDVDLRHGLTVGEEPVPDCGENQLWVETEQRCRVLYSPSEMETYNETSGDLHIVFQILNGTLPSEIVTKIEKLILNLSPHIQRIELLMLDNVTMALTLFMTNVTAISKETFIKTAETWSHGSKNLTLLYFTNLTTQVSCDVNYHVYNRSEYIFLTNNRIKLLVSERRVTPDKFKITSNYSVRVCPEPEGIEDFVMSIVTIICLGISIIALILRLVLHCLMMDHRPARLQVCLAVSLLIGMVSFLLNPLVLHSHSSVCYTVAVVIHWSFLAAFCWMTVIGWDILNMFKASSDFQRIGQGNKKFVIYSLYSWLFPTVAVCIALAVDHSNVDSKWHPAYADKLCWLSGRIGLLIYFVSPVALQILINIIIFIACCIYLQKNKMPSGSISQEKQRLWLHLRLLILMGITWVVGFLAIPLDSDVLWYIFIILNALQGIFLLLVYILANRTQQRLAETLRKLRKSSTTAGTSSTTVSSKL